MEHITASQVASPPSEIVIDSGERLTIETIAGFIQQVRNAMNVADTIVIEFHPDVEMDITALQVFCSAHTTATSNGKNLIHRGPIPKIMMELAMSAGAERCDHCINNRQHCFRQLGG